jgi:hypothetical protein
MKHHATIITAAVITAAALAAGAAAFEAPPLPEWLRPGTWDTLRVTARGASAPQERITITSAPDATRIIIK